jgi:hypothetical protein
LYPNSNANNIVEWKQHLQFDHAKLVQNDPLKLNEPITILDENLYKLENRLKAVLKCIENDITIVKSNTSNTDITDESDIIPNYQNVTPDCPKKAVELNKSAVILSMADEPPGYNELTNINNREELSTTLLDTKQQSIKTTLKRKS